MPGVIDHPLVREAGRRHGGEMLQAVDGIWATIGRTNLGHRSLAMNGELNVAVYDVVAGGALL